MNITILGGGSWGSALAIHLAKLGHDLKIWEFFEKQAKEMQESRQCPFLKGIQFTDNVVISSSLKESLADSEVVFVVVPSDKVEITLKNARGFLTNQKLIICSKGFAQGPKLLSVVAQEIYSGEILCLYGPTHAEEVAKSIFSGIVLAGKNPQGLASEFSSNNFKFETTDDLIGVQVSAALKNILAVLIGVIVGSNLGDNTKAYVITKGLAEIKELGVAWGAKDSTFYGLAGLGDVIVTTSSTHSRNRHVGVELGKGHRLQDVLDEMKMVAEGVSAAKNIPQLCHKFSLKLPLLQGTHDILFNNKKIQEVLSEL